MTLEILWFCLLAFFWTGYFVLEGFDFGVGMLLPVLGRSESDRRTMFESIGPVWDGNEVWLVIAGASTFAAFPVWYATMFSGFYLALLLILAFLIVRVLSFEWRGKAESPGWKAAWAWLNTIASFGVPLLWGIALASLLHGVPIASDQTFAGDFGDLFTCTPSSPESPSASSSRSTARSSSRFARSVTPRACPAQPHASPRPRPWSVRPSSSGRS